MEFCFMSKKAVFNLPVIGLHQMLERPTLDLSKLKFLRVMKQIIRSQRTVHNSLLWLYSLYHHARVKLTFTMKWHINFLFYHSGLEILHHDAASWSAWKLSETTKPTQAHFDFYVLPSFQKWLSTKKIFLDTPEKLVEKSTVAQKLDKTKNALKAQLKIKLKSSE